jgi:hypothetical protein
MSLEADMDCPKCGADITDSYEPDDYSCGIVGGWYCDACDLGVSEHEYPREPMEDDMYPSAAPIKKEIGTPISEISGRPSHPGYDEFCRIAKSWGHE